MPVATSISLVALLTSTTPGRGSLGLADVWLSLTVMFAALCAMGVGRAPAPGRAHALAVMRAEGRRVTTARRSIIELLDVPAHEFVPFVERVRDAYGFDLDVAHNALMGRCREHRRVARADRPSTSTRG